MKQITKKDIIWLFIAVIVVVAGFVFFTSAPAEAPGDANSGDDGGEICAQVITPARNPETGEVKEFPTPCDVPEGWEVIDTQKEQPDFSDYPTDDQFTGSPAEVDFSTHPEARTFRTRIIRAAQEGPNFAGHYTVATWGCGTNCGVHAIIDARTGEIVEYGIISEQGVDYRPDSRLFVVNPPQGAGRVLPSLSAETHYFIITSSALQKL